MRHAVNVIRCSIYTVKHPSVCHTQPYHSKTKNTKWNRFRQFVHHGWWKFHQRIRPKQVFILCLNTSKTWFHIPEWQLHRIHPTYKGGLLSLWESTHDHVLQPKWRWRTVWSVVSLSNGDHFADRYPRHKMLPRLQGVISHVYVWQKAPFPNSSASYTFSASVEFSFFSY